MAVECKVNIKALRSRKEFLFQELTRIHDIVKKKDFVDELEAEIQLASLSRQEASFNTLTNEILTANTLVKQEDAIKTSDLNVFQTLIDAARKYCLKCKIRSGSKGTSPSSSNVKLPKINLPTFSGDIGEWNDFMEQYNATMHNKNISKVEKLTYLRSVLKGEPYFIVSQYEIKEESYQLAYDALIHRYSNPRLLVNHYLNLILGFKFSNSNLGRPYAKFMTVHRAATSSLLNLKVDNLAEYLIFELSYRNLPLHQQKLFDREIDPMQLPTLKDLFDFVDTLARSEELHSGSTTTHGNTNSKGRNQQVLLAGAANNVEKRICFYCQESHALYRCKKFSELPLNAKLDKVKKSGICQQCLGFHKDVCTSKYSCKHCLSQSHHTFLCEKVQSREAPATLSENKLSEPTKKEESTIQQYFNAYLSSQTSPALLGTIKAIMTDQWGTEHDIRAVYDTGSQVNLITYELVQRLGLKLFRAPVDITTISEGSAKVLGATQITLKSSENKSISYECYAVVLSTICRDLPSDILGMELPANLRNLPLADPDFRNTKAIDVLLGAEACMDLIKTQEPIIVKNNPTAIHTIFGYVLTGRVTRSPPVRTASFCVTALDKTLREFWESENIEVPKKSTEEKFCEEHFRNSYKRDSSGRYIVRLPFEQSMSPLGSNIHVAVDSFRRLENRFKINPDLFEAYSEIIQDYLNQGHMSPATTEEQYVLPHHCVYKDSSSTAVRVVFNASSEDDSGYSLNDRLKAGPKLQNELPQLLIKFRFHEVALQADIKQMFRNITLHPEDRRFQHILWSWSPDEPLQQFSLNTVTFGFTSSPYLAQRVLKQLVEDEGKPFPEASEAVLHHTFMDDFVTGAPSVEAAKALRQDLTKLLAKGGFELRKWASSHPEVLEDMPEDQREKHFVFSTGDKGVKILGLLWNQTLDCLQYHVTEFQSTKVTKRSILSYVARIWDCLGWISPVVLKPKSFMQRLWLLQARWDDPLPSDVATDWLQLVSEMHLLKELKIPRRLPVTQNSMRIVGFSDASETAMAANVYLHCTSPNGDCESHLLISKTKLAPLKTWTIPRLELTAAVLLATTISYVREANLKDLPIHLFTDSQIVLAWLRLPPHNLKIFVANRVIQIQETIPDALWNFVPGSENPADLSSRGLKPSQLLDNNLWWHGPEFLQQPVECWPKFGIEDLSLEECPETKSIKCATALMTQTLNATTECRINECINRFSSLIKLQRSIAYVLRFIKNCKSKIERIKGVLTTKELKESLLICVRLTQQNYFSTELNLLKKGKEIPKNLQKLSPFLDKSQLIRAGGRLQRANSLTEEAKHPLILPKNCNLSYLICDYYHIKLLHAGPRTTVAAIRQKFWIMSLQQLVKSRIRRCLRCYKLSATPIQPMMGDLPASRVNISRPFTNVTLDFGGPIMTKESGIRKSTRHKSYFCIFVCMTVKAVHIEAVTDLSTPAFLAAFNRFSSRRGLPKEVYSDCGRNFVGASRDLKECEAFLRKENASIGEFAAVQGVNWIFAPPYGPNFNGLAEAAIKAAKRHLLRQIGEEVVTFEELTTLLCRVEAVLNSRPLTIMTDDPEENDLYLSPSHFLIGGTSLSPPEKTPESLSLRDRWNRIRIKSQVLWKHWSQEYLNTMLQRQKWTRATDNLKIGTIVFITGENLPPLQWPIARVKALHYGSDGIARVATLKSAKGEFRRPISKLLILPD